MPEWSPPSRAWSIMSRDGVSESNSLPRSITGFDITMNPNSEVGAPTCTTVESSSCLQFQLALVLLPARMSFSERDSAPELERAENLEGLVSSLSPLLCGAPVRQEGTLGI
jgi:hypothetical protein